MISNEIREGFKRYAPCCQSIREYLIVGGAAVTFYGYQRMSGISIQRPEIKTALDFWYNPTISNFHNLSLTLVESGVEKGQLDAIIFDSKKTFLKINPGVYHLDFLCQMAGLPLFRASTSTAMQRDLDGNRIYISGKEDLITNKKALNRPIDRDDLNNLL